MLAFLSKCKNNTTSTVPTIWSMPHTSSWLLASLNGFPSLTQLQISLRNMRSPFFAFSCWQTQMPITNMVAWACHTQLVGCWFHFMAFYCLHSDKLQNVQTHHEIWDAAFYAFGSGQMWIQKIMWWLEYATCSWLVVGFSLLFIACTIWLQIWVVAFLHSFLGKCKCKHQCGGLRMPHSWLVIGFIFCFFLLAQQQTEKPNQYEILHFWYLLFLQMQTQQLLWWLEDATHNQLVVGFNFLVFHHLHSNRPQNLTTNSKMLHFLHLVLGKCKCQAKKTEKWQ